MKNYRQITITTTPVNNEIISGLLWQFEITGINETDNGVVVFAEESNDSLKEDITGILDEAVSQNIIDSFDVSEELLESKNWNEEYEKKVRVIEVTDRLVIKPTFKDYTPKENQIIITIDPKMSFGTGEHQTTKLVMTFLEKYVKAGDRVLDVGSGTGVLAITSVMLGASGAIGIDNDEWCLLNGTENVKANGLENKVDIRLGEIQNVAEKDFDLVVANINKHILMDIGEALAAKIKKTGYLILSGLLDIDENDIAGKYSTLDLELAEKAAMDEWTAFVYRKK